MIAACAALAILVFGAAASHDLAKNLLKNGGFESVRDGSPEHWALFVAPASGAFGRHEPEGGRNGGGAVLLHTPLPYASDPLNNWSQTLEGPFTAGQKLHFRGAVRTQEATEAFHLIQAWRRRPGGVVGTASTRQDLPHGGTRDWAELSTTFEVPPGTDFIVVRCVLLGVGSAWFDDCYLGAEAPPAGTSPAAAPETGDTAERADDVPPAPTVRAAPPEEIDVLEAQMKVMREAGESMRGDMYRLRETNEALRNQLDAVRRELEAVRETLRAGAPDLPEAPGVPDVPETAPQEPGTVPPLVPSHLDWEAP